MEKYCTKPKFFIICFFFIFYFLSNNTTRSGNILFKNYFKVYKNVQKYFEQLLLIAKRKLERFDRR